MQKLSRKSKTKKRRRKKPANRFSGQVLKGQFEWEKAPFCIKSVCASVGLSDYREALIFGVRIFALAQRAQIKFTGETQPPIAKFKPDYEDFGINLIASLMEKLFPPGNTQPFKNPCENFLLKLGIILDTLKKQACEPKKVDPLIWSYHSLRKERFLPPTVKQIEESHCRGFLAFRDSTSSIRKKVKKLGLHTLGNNDLQSFKKIASRYPMARRIDLGDLSPLTWPIADFYEALIWKTCPDHIFEVLIVKNAIYRSLAGSVFFKSLSKTEEFKNGIYSIVDVVYNHGFELNDSFEIQSDLGPLSEYCRKTEQTNFLDLERGSAFSKIRPKILQKFKNFVEETVHEEYRIRL